MKLVKNKYGVPIFRNFNAECEFSCMGKKSDFDTCTNPLIGLETHISHSMVINCPEEQCPFAISFNENMKENMKLLEEKIVSEGVDNFFLISNELSDSITKDEIYFNYIMKYFGLVPSLDNSQIPEGNKLFWIESKSD